MDIVVDFDGTVVTHDFPNVGKDIGAAPVLRELVERGHRLILFTMRSNCNGNTGASEEFPKVINGNFLDDAVDWFYQNGIKLYGIQSNPDQKTWTTSPKAYGQLIIDDAALGCPLMNVAHISERPFVDWARVRILLKRQGLL